MKKVLWLALMLSALACSSSRHETTASIVERKQVGNDRLLIKYRYQVNGLWFADSLEMPNRVLADTAVTVIFDAKQPAQHKLQLPE